MDALKNSIIKWLEDNRSLVVLFFCLPASYIFDKVLGIYIWIYRELFYSSQKHDEKVKVIQRQVQKWAEQPQAQRKLLCTARPNWLSLSTTFFRKDLCERIPIPLYDILHLNEEKMTVKVEPMVTVGEITNYLIPRGYTLAVTLEIKDATLGGLAIGTGMTTHSHKAGLYQETIKSYEVILGDGSLVKATKTENKDLYATLPWSHGSLGFLVALELEIIKVKPYVKLTYAPVIGQKNYCHAVRDASGANGEKQDIPDFVELTIFSKTEAVLMCGDFSENDPNLPINNCARWYKPWFYEYTRQFLESGPYQELIPLRDYLLRHNRSIFWVVQDMLPAGNKWWFRYPLGWLLPPKPAFLKWTTTPGVREYTFTKQVFQDIVLPISELERQVDTAVDLFQTFPLLVYPCRVYARGKGSGQVPSPDKKYLVSGTNYAMYNDLGIYGVPGQVKSKTPYDPVSAMRKMEKFTRDVGGFSFLYADIFMTKEEFEEMFDLSLYEKGLNVNLGKALQFLREYDREASIMCNAVTNAQWNFATNITDLNRRKMLEEQTRKMKFDRASWRKAVSFAWSRVPDPLTRRQLKMIAVRGRSSLTDDKFNEIHHLIAEMKELYTRTRLCPYKKMGSTCNFSLDNEVSKVMAQSKNYDELLYYWRSWHEAVGPPLKNKYMRYVQLANQAARLNGFADAGDQMREAFEDDYFQQNIAEAISAITPLYKNLFTYVRTKLIERYGDKIRRDGPLPAHILGNMWAQNWEGIYDIVQPFPAARKLDVTLDMILEGYTPLRMFQDAQKFFTSMGMKPMPPEFWRYSIFEKPIDREIKCTASAWDFCNRIDYRIKQCTKVTMEDFLSTHHEMSHLQYYLQYKDQPLLFRQEALPGFHEAVSDAIGLSVFTPKHLHDIGLYNNSTDDYEMNINFLMLMALQKVTYMPFAYIVDQWRWRVFSDGVADMTTRWWELRLQYQGIVPPISRSERDFDPASKYHVPADIPYAKYFVGVVMQFQLYESLCEISGHIGELHTCDIYNSREAGRLLSDVLSVGASRNWKDVIRELTRGKTNRIDASAMLRYFEPLNVWLKRQNQMEPAIGWITNHEDTALFAHWYKSTGTTQISDLTVTLLLIISLFNLLGRFII
ncbi:angiotensin-converting enzyme isoform X2 [Cephus cinctus]|uniref:Angiotensin-converting enzyme n=1 Tax=Cephus cinctus TaxID=211228 RepID=A0AAJ7W207_CEPCN|nr:angiotensin-converting enzyme isoform X2 [Cephus cinctus]